MSFVFVFNASTKLVLDYFTPKTENQVVSSHWIVLESIQYIQSNAAQQMRLLP